MQASGESTTDPSFWEKLGQAAGTIGITVVVVFIAWLIVRWGIIWLTRGIERGDRHQAGAIARWRYL